MNEKIINTKAFLYGKINEKKPDTAKEYKIMCEGCSVKAKNSKSIIITYIYALVGFALEFMVFFGFMAEGEYYTNTHAVPLVGIVYGFVCGALNCIYGFTKLNSKKHFSKVKAFIISYILFPVIACIASVIIHMIDFNVDIIQSYPYYNHLRHLSVGPRIDMELTGIIIQVTGILIAISVIFLIRYYTKCHAAKKDRLSYYNTYILPLEDLVITEYKQSTNAEDYINLGNLKDWDGSVV